MLAQRRTTYAPWLAIACAGLLIPFVLISGCESAGPAPAPAPQPPAPERPRSNDMPLSRAERVDLQNRALDQLLLAAESDLDVVSCNAIEALLKIAPREGRSAFQQALRAESPLVRYAAYVALGQLQVCEAQSQFFAGVRDPHPHVRLAAAFAATRCGAQGYARVLAETLTDSPEQALRAEAAALIGRLGDPKAKRWLKMAATLESNQRSDRVLLAIHGALARLGDEDGIRRLVLYSRGKTAERTEALLILADLEHQRLRDDLLYALMGPEEEYVEARLIAARALGKLGFADGYGLAMQMLEYDDPNPNPSPRNPDRTFPVRSLAIHALAEIGDPQALPALRKIAADPEDPRLQVAASYAICRILQQWEQRTP